MKKYISLISLLVWIGTMLPVSVFAASVQVYPTITNAYGGTADYRALNSCVTDSSGAQQCAAGVPTFTIPSGTYSVSVTPPLGYSYVLGSTCSGTVAADDSVQCDVKYNDGAPIVLTAAPSATGSVQTAPIVSAVSAIDAVPIVDQAAQIAELQRQVAELYKILVALLMQRLTVLSQ